MFSVEDKPSGAYNLQEICNANRFKWDLRLCKPPAVGREFSWTNGLPRLGSDHVPIRLEVGGHFSSPRSFRFEKVWFTADGFREMIQQWWEDLVPTGCGAFVISKKLAWLRECLRVWAKESFGSIKLKKLNLLQELESLDIIKESRCLLPNEVISEQHLLKSLETIHKQEEIYWRQRSKLQWLKEGDGNTNFFHAVANERNCQNLIPGISQDGRLVSDPRGIGRIFVSRFQQQFGSRRSSHFKVDFPKLLSLKQHVDLVDLDHPFSRDEIKEVVFSLGGDKAPRPDGFPIFFFKQSWETVKEDIFKLCEDFYDGRANLERINWANIALIPKVESLEHPGDYRPISQINSSLKILSKILATRLGKVMDKLVDHAQSAFLKGRCILDNVATAEELIFSMKRRRLPGYILKVDFAKAFNLVDWEFLLELLKARGFRDKWGLRQGDPLSLLLFIMVTDMLSVMFNHALESMVNFSKTCLYSICMGVVPEEAAVLTMNYATGLLPVTFLGIPISGGRLRKQDWERLIAWCMGRAPMNIWPELFNMSAQQNATFNDLGYLLGEQPFCEEEYIVQIREKWRSNEREEKDKKSWSLIGNGVFSVKSVYNFVNDGGLRCDLAKFFWKSNCPKKINMFNSLFDALADNAKTKMEDTMAAVRRSLEFVGPGRQTDSEVDTAEEALEHTEE
ncbi:uncharacterized protein LOC120265177 [Dioscorea cayenensis subsp. rotundata]|uniref:Uncharacterized protein LOC120265177 n=1 Tax=Dioscorea cayennensis subsp. rotundata TaxID=55577 RepID=A0AB40BNG6_DIOCR|nr:uncharacterized protein LOC120265177 [Dioscorea cayenensis subsp. rotundata]